MKNPSRQKGFTLLEVMVTVSIIAIALISIFDLHTQTISMNIDTQFNATAPFLARKKWTELEMLPIHELTPGSGDFGEEFPGFAWKVAAEDIQAEELKTSRFLLKKIDIQISFNHEEMVYEMRTYRAFQE